MVFEVAPCNCGHAKKQTTRCDTISQIICSLSRSTSHTLTIFSYFTLSGSKLASVGIEVNLLKKIRLEIAVNDNFVERTVRAIIDGAKTGQIGDGKIFILDLPECIRIRTEERGGEAIG